MSLLGPSLFSETYPEITLEKILELGQGEFLFSHISSVCEDESANFYVLDRDAFTVFKFSPDGKLLLSFGGKGQGPGDFLAPFDIHVLSDGRIVVSEDTAFISLFDSGGNFINRLSVERGLALRYIDDNLFYAWVWNEEGQTQHLVDRAGTFIKTFYSVSRENFSVSAPDESGRLIMFNFASSEIAPSFVFYRSRDHAVVAINDRYEFPILNLKGETLATIQRDIKPQKLSTKEQEYILDQIQESRNWPDRIMKLIRKNMPRVKNLFDSILISDSRVFVIRIKENLIDPDSPYPLDVFSLSGEYAGSTTTPIKPIAVSERHLYALTYDAESNLLLHKYRYVLPPSFGQDPH